jgi:hypothetical protein
MVKGKSVSIQKISITNENDFLGKSPDHNPNRKHNYFERFSLNYIHYLVVSMLTFVIQFIISN